MKTKFDELIEDIQVGTTDVNSIDFSQYNRRQTETIAKTIYDRLVSERLQTARDMENASREAKLNKENLIKVRDAVMKLEDKVVLAERTSAQVKSDIACADSRQLAVLRILRGVVRKTPQQRDIFLAHMADQLKVALDGDMDQFESLFEIVLALVAT